MSTNEAITFWHENLGRYLSSAPAGESSKARVPTRMKRGVDLNTLGAGIDAHYIVTQGHAWLIGKIEGASSSDVTYVPTDGPDAIRGDSFIAEWLISDAMKTPFMVGVIGKANPNASFRLSHTAAKAFYCEANKGLSFNINTVRNAKTLIGTLSWWKIVNPALRQYFSLQYARQSADANAVQRELDKMTKLLDKTPGLRALLPTLNVKPDSGEHQLLGWLARNES